MDKRSIADMTIVSLQWLRDLDLPTCLFEKKLGTTKIPMFATLRYGQYNSHETFFLMWVELVIQYGNADECGYFWQDIFKSEIFS